MKKRDAGISLISLLVSIAIAIGAAAWWKHSQDFAKKQRIAAEQAQVAARELQELAAQNQREVEAQQLALEEQKAVSAAEDERKC